MKVAHLTTVDLSLRYLVFPQLRATNDLGMDTFGISAAGPWVEGLEADGIRHVALRSSTRGMNPVADAKSAFELWRILRAERPNILHTHNPKPGLYGRVVGRLSGVPIVVNTVHGLYATPGDRWLKRAVVYSLEAIASRFSDAELIQSEEDVQTIKRLRIAPAKRVAYLGNGVDLTRFDPTRIDGDERTAIRSEIGATEDQVVVGMVGRLVAEKGYPEFFAAARQLADERLVFVCVGPDDEDKADALPRSMIAAAKDAGIRFLGMRTDVDRLYRAMDIFVLPSHREGFPRSAMEAAAMGLPVIATDIRGCREVVAQDDNGFLVPVDDPQSLADAIRKLSTSADLRKRMGAAGRSRAEARFDEQQVVATVTDTYRRIARNKGMPFPTPPDREVTLRAATGNDTDALARLHSDGISTGFLPRLGPRFMRRLYRALIGYDGAVVIVADDGDGPIGFVAGVLDTGRFYKHFVKHHGVAAAWAALPRAARPSVMRRVWESLRYEGAEHEAAELLATALIPEARGRGLGTRLGKQFIGEIAGLGASEILVVVGSENAQAIAAYRKMGFDPAGTMEVHAGEESAVLSWSA